MKADAATERVIGGAPGDEDPCPAPGMDEALGGKGSKRMAHGVAIYAEAGGKLCLGRQATAGGDMAACDFGPQGCGDFAPDGGAGHGFPFCHRSFIKASHGRLDIGCI